MKCTVCDPKDCDLGVGGWGGGGEGGERGEERRYTLWVGIGWVL